MAIDQAIPASIAWRRAINTGSTPINFFLPIYVKLAKDVHAAGSDDCKMNGFEVPN
jgi:hypothetical protein